MRTSVEDLQQTQEASSVNVQPTKQATKPSYKHLGKRQILDAPISDVVETYLVSMYATNRLSQQFMSIVRNYDELHPLMAIGRAVVEFLQDYNAQIEKIVIQKKINR